MFKFITVFVLSGEKSAEKSDDEEIIFVSETKVTPEEEKKALDLMLPKNFYAYLQKPPCSGCIGCNPDDYIFPVLKTTKSETQTTKTMTETKKSDQVTDTLSTFSFCSPTVTSGQNKTFNPFGTVSSTTTKSEVTFSFTTPVNTQITNKSPLAPAKLASPTTPVFGTTKDSTETKNMFSGSPSLFSGTPKTEESNLFRTNIFGNISTTENKSTPTTPASTIPQNTASSFSFTKAQSDIPKSTGSIFGTSNFSTQSPVFGGSLFGQKDDKNKDKPLIFGNSGQVTQTATPTFGAQTTISSIFGGKPFVTGQTAPAFGSVGTTTASFGPQTTTVFGSSISTPTFGSVAQTKTFSSVAQTTQSFGSPDTTSTLTFGTVAQTGAPTFATVAPTTTSGSTFGSVTQSQSSNTGPLLQCDSNLSFAALASDAPTFAKKGKKKMFFTKIMNVHIQYPVQKFMKQLVS